jgi:hypothetical protein
MTGSDRALKDFSFLVSASGTTPGNGCYGGSHSTGGDGLAFTSDGWSLVGGDGDGVSGVVERGGPVWLSYVGAT